MPTKIKMPAEKIAMILITRPAKTARGREVQAAVLARVERQIEIEGWIKEALRA